MLDLKAKLIASVPKLGPMLTKGQAGRIGIVGGCEEYCGAPYFAAMASLHMGADLVHVICDIGAAPVIKSYSPELMVHPYLRTESSLRKEPLDRDNNATPSDFDTMVTRVSRLLDLFHCIVIGPGLGRDPVMLSWVSHLIGLVRQRNLPLIIDADGLYLISQHPHLIQSYPKAILTPNHKELDRLCTAMAIPINADRIQAIASRFNAYVLAKGPTDTLVNPNSSIVLECNQPGGLKRCGGQGDILSGVLACLVGWASIAHPSDHKDWVPQLYAASCITRNASKLAYEQFRRATLAEHVLKRITDSFVQLGYDSET